VTYQLGKLPAAPRPKDLRFSAYRTDGGIQVPDTFGHQELIAPDGWGMLGNDQVGNCVFAGADHESLLWNTEAGVTVEFTADTAIADYSAVTGYQPGDPSTDRGTDVHNALEYRRTVGIQDTVGGRHRIAAYVSVTPGEFDHLLQALYVFSAVAIGVELPDTAEQQFQAGQPWDVVPGARIVGGHYVCAVGRPGLDVVDIVTWGRVQPMTRRFFETYCDECYALLSAEMLNSGETLEGFDLEQLQADLATLTG